MMEMGKHQQESLEDVADLHIRVEIRVRNMLQALLCC